MDSAVRKMLIFFVVWHPTVANPFSLGFNFNYGDMTMSQLAGHGYC